MIETLPEKKLDYLEALCHSLEEFREYNDLGWPDIYYTDNIELLKRGIFYRYLDCKRNNLLQEANELLEEYLGKPENRK